MAARYFQSVHGVMVLIGAKRLVPGEVVHTSAGPLGVGRWPSGLSEVAREVAQAVGEDRHPRVRDRGDRRPQVEQDGDQPEQRDLRAAGAVGSGGPGGSGGPRLHGRRLRGGGPGPAGGRDPVRGPAGQLDRGPDPEPARAGDERHRPGRRGAAAPALALAGSLPRRWARSRPTGSTARSCASDDAHGVPTPYSRAAARAHHRDGPSARAPRALHAAGAARAAVAARGPAPWRDRTGSARSWPPGQTCVGPLFQEFWSPELFEFCALAGFDFLIADGEHAGVDPQGVRDLARAAQGAGATALARVPNGEASLVLRYLDAGVEGLILPHCNSAADAEGFVTRLPLPAAGDPRGGELEPRGGLRLHPDAERTPPAVGSRGAVPGSDRRAARRRSPAGDPSRRRPGRLLRRGRGHGAHPRPPVLRRGHDAP